MSRTYAFGTTPWGRWFIDAMESMADSARLKRGRGYAADGNVMELDVEDGVVRARVEGSSRPFYSVSIAFNPLDHEERRALGSLLAADPMLAGRIAAGELPMELIGKLEARKIDLIPRRWTDMKRSCDCPDSGDPCKHMAAVYYILAQEMDRDPSTLFRLRGIELADFVAKSVKSSGGRGPLARKEGSTSFVATSFVATSSVAMVGGAPTRSVPVASGPDSGLPTVYRPVAGGPGIRDPLIPVFVEVWRKESGAGRLKLGGLGEYGAAMVRLLPPQPPVADYDLRGAFVEFYADLASSRDRLLSYSGDRENHEKLARAVAAGEPEIGLRVDSVTGAVESASIKVKTPGGKKLALSLLEAVRLFLSFDSDEGSAGYRFMRAFSLAMRMLIASGALVPDIIVEGGGGGEASKASEVAGNGDTPRTMRAIWKPASFGSDLRSLLDAVEGLAVPPTLSFTSRSSATNRGATNRGATNRGARRDRDSADGRGTRRPGDDGKVPDPRSTVLVLASAFLGELVEALRFLPSLATDIAHPVTAALFRGRRVDVSSPSDRSIPGALDSWLSVFDIASSGFEYELIVDFAGGGEGAEEEEAGREGDLSGTSSPAYDLSAKVRPAGTRLRRMGLRGAAARYGSSVLTFPAMLAAFVPELASLGSASSVRMDEESLSRLVIESEPILARLGVRVVLPKELRDIVRPRTVLTAKALKGMGKLKSFLDMQSMLHFEWRVSLGDSTLGLAEFESLVDEGRALVRFNGKYIRLSAKEAASILDKLRKGPKPDAFDAMRELFAGSCEFDAALEERIRNILPRAGEDIPVPKGLVARLRPYQARGFRWLAENAATGFGSVLADDMGLGKTIQAIALILHLKETGRLGRGAIVCAPASLLTNWEREFAKFAPGLAVSTYYGSGRRRGTADVLLTSYETYLKDAKKLKGLEWGIAILDEAHLIKNPDAKRSRAVKEISASHRLALSGTPVENHLGELWSIFDFALPGYLRSSERFASEFRGPIEIERSEAVAARLRAITTPFLMRRLKTDRDIVPDLPDKIIVDEYASMTADQVALYESVVREMMARIEGSEGVERQGLILALIIALKQICNHPRNYDRESPPDAECSGKSRLLLAILESAMESGEKVLVFSQYVEMLEILRAMIERDLGIDAFMLHGGMTKIRRTAVVDGFQSAPGGCVFLVSLKAGGMGLNLTAATRVIHYDLWFNPAVENQATDRAFRIGQTKNVFVHRFITKDSFEERIQVMLVTKRELADLTIRSGETWLTELDDAGLAKLLAR